MSNLHKITVLGGGLLGGQIAWHSAFKGKEVVVYDIAEDALDRCRAAHERYAAIYLAEVGARQEDINGAHARLSYTTDLPAAVKGRDLVIEAVLELPDVKSAVYNQIAPLLDPHTIVATNTSTLLPRDFAEATGRPDKYCAMHFANLIWVMNLVEIMAHSNTAPETLIAVTEFGIELGMIPIPVRKEHNGYLTNTWLLQLINAAQTLVTNEIATPEDIDRTYLIVNPGATRGPIGLMDVISLSTVYLAMQVNGEAFGDEQMLANARYLKEHFVDTGKIGTGVGVGYYTYPNPAYEAADFLDVPDISKAAEIADLVKSQ